MSLSERIRPGCEAAAWVIEEVKALEARIADAEREREALRELLRDVLSTCRPMHTEFPVGNCCAQHRVLYRIDAALERQP